MIWSPDGATVTLRGGATVITPPILRGGATLIPPPSALFNESHNRSIKGLLLTRLTDNTA